MPIEIKKVCKALATLWEISDNMENYLDQKGKSGYFLLYILFKIVSALLWISGFPSAVKNALNVSWTRRFLYFLPNL